MLKILLIISFQTEHYLYTVSALYQSTVGVYINKNCNFQQLHLCNRLNAHYILDQALDYLCQLVVTVAQLLMWFAATDLYISVLFRAV